MVLYVGDILLAANDLNVMRETRDFLPDNFEMEDVGETSYMIGIEIFRDRSEGL